MHSNKSFRGRKAASVRGIAALLIGGATAVLPAGAANGQELTHRFINPSFGGNPFYSEHLLGIANIHRPAEPEEPAAPAPTDEELEADRIRARLLTQLSGDILDQIQDAQPGQSGTFEFGNQRVSFVRTPTETRVTFLNTSTGATNTIVLPVQGGSNSLATAMSQRSSISAEQVLGAPGAATAGASNTALLAPPPL